MLAPTLRLQTTSAKWLPIEMTIVGGSFDKRKVWQNIFVDGDAKGREWNVKSQEDRLEHLSSRWLIVVLVSHQKTSEDARAKRASIQGIHMINGMTSPALWASKKVAMVILIVIRSRQS